MYKSYFQSEGFFRPRIAENVTISGKLKEHTVDIYFEFIQMNNLERTVIKVIEGTKVTENDMWEFANVLKDLHFFAKGIIYYDDRVSSGAKKVAELTNIDLKKFDLLDEVRKYNPDIDEWIASHDWCVTTIPDFDGEVNYYVDKQGSAHIVGVGNINFFTDQTGL